VSYIVNAFLILLSIVLTLLLHGESHASQEIERSFWVHASLATQPLKGYWGSGFPYSEVPTEREIHNAARVLLDEYGANRLYLIYHGEILSESAEKAFSTWSNACADKAELVPTLVLRMYDKNQTPVFSPEKLNRLAEFLKNSINKHRIAVYDVYPDREQSKEISVLEKHFPRSLVRVGVQPGEKLASFYEYAVQDTWSAFCHGKSNDDWLSPGFGMETLRSWVQERNAGSVKICWDLIVVAWDYEPTERGGYPGYDDANKNMPLPSGRNLLAAKEIIEHCSPEVFLGFSSDLFILQANSMAKPHDGKENSFYQTLKRGEVYQGYYAEPFEEAIRIYKNVDLVK